MFGGLGVRFGWFLGLIGLDGFWVRLVWMVDCVWWLGWWCLVALQV